MAEAFGELVTALSSAGLNVTDDIAGADIPCALVYGDGVDVTHIGRGQVAASFRITLAAGGWDGAGVTGTLVGLVSTALGALASLDHWVIADVSPDLVTNLAGGRLRGADISASRMVDV